MVLHSLLFESNILGNSYTEEMILMCFVLVSLNLVEDFLIVRNSIWHRGFLPCLCRVEEMQNDATFDASRFEFEHLQASLYLK